MRLLERFSPEFRDCHIEAEHTGSLVAVDTFMVGSLKGVGRVYLQSDIDCHSRYAFGRLYTSKLPVTAVHVLDEDVLPFFEEHSARIETILSDNGREFCGRPDRHPYELFLQLEGMSIGQRRSGGHKATGLSKDFTARFWMSIFASRAGRNGMNRWRKCKLTLTATSVITTTSSRTKEET